MVHLLIAISGIRHLTVKNLLSRLQIISMCLHAVGYGNWSDYGCETVYNMSDPDAGVTCLCNHLTSFAILLVS